MSIKKRKKPSCTVFICQAEAWWGRGLRGVGAPPIPPHPAATFLPPPSPSPRPSVSSALVSSLTSYCMLRSVSPSPLAPPAPVHWMTHWSCLSASPTMILNLLFQLPLPRTFGCCDPGLSPPASFVSRAHEACPGFRAVSRGKPQKENCKSHKSKGLLQLGVNQTSRGFLL